MNNSITPRNTFNKNTPSASTPSQPAFVNAILSSTLQTQIAKSLPDEKARARFTSAIIELMTSSWQLQKCSPASVVAAALRGEGQGLILGHGYYVTPYGTKASYITSYKGYIQLALSTGLYEDIDCIEVREGEFKGRNKRTGKEEVDFSVYDTEEERMNHKPIGFYAYFQLKDGMFRSEYWSYDKLFKHAEKYSPAFKMETFKKYKTGQLTPEEKRKVEMGSPWYTNYQRMCAKTVLRSLLNSGFAPLSNEIRNFIASDRDYVVPDEPVMSRENDPLIIDSMPKVENLAKPTEQIKAETPSELNTGSQTHETAVSEEIPTPAPKTATRRTKTAKTEKAEETATESAQASLFDK